MRLGPGDDAPTFRTPAAGGDEIALDDVDGWRHLAFLRYAGCPSCLLHTRRLARRIDEIRDAGLTLLVLFHSPVEDVRETCAELPYPVLADPDRTIFDAYGVESDWRGLLSWRTLSESVQGIAEGERWRPSMAKAGWTGLPADVLVDPDGVVRHARYGRDFADSLGVDDLLDLLETHR